MHSLDPNSPLLSDLRTLVLTRSTERAAAYAEDIGLMPLTKVIRGIQEIEDSLARPFDGNEHLATQAQQLRVAELWEAAAQELRDIGVRMPEKAGPAESGPASSDVD